MAAPPLGSPRSRMPRIMQGTNGTRHIDSGNAPTARPLGGARVGTSMKRGLLAALLAAAVAVPAASAPAATHRHKPPTVKTVIRDCAADGKLKRRYSLTLLKRARRHLPTDVRDYTNCSRVISRAIKREQRRHHHKAHR